MDRQEIVCKRVVDAFDPLIDRLEQTYKTSFPKEERRPFSKVKQLITEDSRFGVIILLRKTSYVGFITTWNLNNIIFVEHFAIDESARNGGVGAKAMRLFLAECLLPVVLEVEVPQDQLSKRRIGFYKRLGFVLDNHPYQQPPYREGAPWLDMHLMTFGKIDLSTSFETVKNELYTHVYAMV